MKNLDSSKPLHLRTQDYRSIPMVYMEAQDSFAHLAIRLQVHSNYFTVFIKPP